MLRNPSALNLENPFNDVELDDGLRLAPLSWGTTAQRTLQQEGDDDAEVSQDLGLTSGLFDKVALEFSLAVFTHSTNPIRIRQWLARWPARMPRILLK